MPKDDSLRTSHDSALLKEISSSVCQTIITIQEQQPELLLEKYRNVPWHSARNQSSLTAKLTEVLGQAQEWDTLIQKLQKLLTVLLVPESSNSPILIHLIEKIGNLKPVNPVLNGSAIVKDIYFSEPSLNSSQQDLTSSKTQKNTETVDQLVRTHGTRAHQTTGIAVLLLDAENIQLNPEKEQFLTTICTYPILVKIAFANWCSMGKLDVEFHERNYDLIHVPAGKDNADGKMIIFGSAIHERFPKAKEVLVCSSDKVMTNLCNHLQQNGLTVYRVSKDGDTLSVWNSATGKIINYIFTSLPKIPSIEQFIQQLEELIRVEQKRTKNCWVKLGNISHAFQEKYKLSINRVISKHFPGKDLKYILINYPAKFVIHQLKKESGFYVTLFDINQKKQVDSQPINLTNPHSSSINSKRELEDALKNIITDLTNQSPGSYVNIGVLGSKFVQQYGKSITDQIKSLHINGSFINFLHSCSSLKVKETEKGWEVTAR